MFFWYFPLLNCIGHELHNYDGVFSVQPAMCYNAVKLKILMYFKAACNSWCIFFWLHYANLHYVSLQYLFINVCSCRISLYIEGIVSSCMLSVCPFFKYAFHTHSRSCFVLAVGCKWVNRKVKITRVFLHIFRWVGDRNKSGWVANCQKFCNWLQTC